MATDTSTSLYSRISHKPGADYAIAVLVTAVALLVRLALNPFLGDSSPYITLFPAVAFTAWYCGVGPAILSTVLGAVGVQYWFVLPMHSLRLHSTRQAVGILTFFI